MGPFWEEHKDLLREITSLNLPSGSSLNYSDSGAEYVEDENRYLTYVVAFKLTGSPSKLRCINMEASFNPQTLELEQEMIRFSVGTIESGYEITLKGEEVDLRHKKWLRSILERGDITSLFHRKAYP
ncbi:MAG: hypothetical protein NWE95_01830 [Candidatus Bathyarchaeota archaeon]|nr:hypothetical protein [Candidatus Bathyarchaeota archaeon]